MSYAVPYDDSTLVNTAKGITARVGGQYLVDSPAATWVRCPARGRGGHAFDVYCAAGSAACEVRSSAGAVLVTLSPGQWARMVRERDVDAWTPFTGGGAAATATPPQVHGAGVATWGALPAAGTFTTEVRPVADLTGSGRTGAGAAIWDGAAWQPLGGNVAGGLFTQSFTAAAGQLVFALAQAPSTPASTELTLRGAPRDFGTDFTVAGTTVTLTMPGVTVFAGDNVTVQHD